MVPRSARYVIVGAGVHGLSTAYHLAGELRARRRGDGGDVLVLDKTGPGAGATGIACGVIRNNYSQPAMRRLMAHSVSIWESHRESLSYRPVGYVQLAPEAMREGVARIHAEQRDIGYPSTLVEGEAACRAYMRELFPDWRARGITSILHEKRGGYAGNRAAVDGLRAMAEGAGVRILSGVRVTGLTRPHHDGAVRAVETDRGTIECEHLVVAVGPWIRELWAMLGLPDTVGHGGGEHPMWTYWLVQEGTVETEPLTAAGRRPSPVIHVDTDAPLHDDAGALVTDALWGIYYKPDARGVQGGSMPRRLGGAGVAVDPYGPARSAHTAGDDFARLWTAGLAHCHERFAGAARLYAREPSGGVGCFTPDCFPVFDTLRQNAYVIADSTHGFKMIGVGALVAKELMGEPQDLLEPFRFSRYARGEPHPASNSPFPWS
jgi:glycine/D-amino acid oxidase-like deaminating enzyme